MIRKFALLSPLVLALLAVTASIPDARALSYTVSGGSVSANSGDGLIIDTALNLPNTPFTFSLNNGQSQTFSFFDIWTPETTVNADDKTPRDITATLSFSDPLTDALMEGLTFGGEWHSGLKQWGEVVWDDPAPIFHVAGRIFQITLSDEVFSEGWFGLNNEWCYGATVKATVKQIGTYTPVPDSGSTAMLLGLALLVVATASKRKVAL